MPVYFGYERRTNGSKKGGATCHRKRHFFCGLSPMSLLNRLSRQNLPTVSSPVTLVTRHLSESSASAATSKLHDRYSFTPPASLSPETQTHDTVTKPNKKQKPRYRPPSSLDRTGRKPAHSNLPFDFRYSYTESSPTVRPVGIREPKYSPFGPGRIDRPWTGVCAPAVDPKVQSLEGEEDPKLEEKGRMMRERIQGNPLTVAERRALVLMSLKNKTKSQINLGKNYLFIKNKIAWCSWFLLCLNMLIKMLYGVV